MEFPRQEYWSGLPFLPPRDLHESGIEPESLAQQADWLLSEPSGKSNDWSVMLKGWEGLTTVYPGAHLPSPSPSLFSLDPTLHPTPIQGTTVTQTGGPSA